jgi:transcriptional regulator with XRE-family HTH domain
MVRFYRQRAGLTQSALAGQVGVSKSFLSQLEHDIAAPSIDSLRRLAAAFEIPLFYLLPDTHRPNGIVRRDERKIIRPSTRDVSYELLSPDLKGQIEMIRMVLPPHSVSVAKPMGHPGEEVATITRGAVTVVVGPDAYVLEGGDTIRFDSAIPHQVVNSGDAEAEIIAAIAPPRF